MPCARGEMRIILICVPDANDSHSQTGMIPIQVLEYESFAIRRSLGSGSIKALLQKFLQTKDLISALRQCETFKCKTLRVPRAPIIQCESLSCQVYFQENSRNPQN